MICYLSALYILFALCALVQVSAYEECREFNSTESKMLRFRHPWGDDVDEDYPAPLYLGYAYEPLTYHCCASGFKNIEWYFDDELLGPSNIQTHEFLQSKQRIVIFSLPPGNHNLTCVVEGEGNGQLEHTLEMEILDNPKCESNSQPRFIKLPESVDCVKEGDAVNISARVQYPNDTCIAIKESFIVVVTYDNGDIAFGNTSKNLYYSSIDTKTLISDMKYVIRSIDQRFIDVDLYAVPYTHTLKDKVPTAKFVLKSCQELKTAEVITLDDDTGHLKVILPAVIIPLVVLTAFLFMLYFCVPEVRLWIRVNIYNRIISPPAMKQHLYDVYLVTADLQYTTTQAGISLLHANNYKLCIPDRDFFIGSIIPEQIMESLNCSERVLAFLSDEAFSDECWCDTATSLALKLNKPLTFVLQHEISKELLHNRPNIRAALKVYEVIKYDDEEQFANVMAKNFPPILPLNNEVKQAKYYHNDVTLTYE